MWYETTIAAPTTEPVSLERAKTASRIDHADDDQLVTDCIATARAHVEEYCGTRVASRSGVALLCDEWADLAALPQAPISAVTSITYVDTDGATQTLATSVYETRLDGLEPSIVLKYNQTWPPIRTGSRITVTVTTGYSTLPASLEGAICLYVRHLYNLHISTGETEVMLPDAYRDLLTNHRRFAA